jgi:hypothetical protein
VTGSTRLLVAVIAGLVVGGVAWCVGESLRPKSRRLASRGQGGARHDNLIVPGIGAGLVVLLVTRWPVAAGATAMLCVAWPKLFVGTAATMDRRRLDGIAKWLEDLRDLQLGSNLDLVEALTESAKRAPLAIEPELSRLASRLGHHLPLTDALVHLADELDHPVADTAVASMVFAAGHASGSALQDTFSQLAVTARDELTARDRIDRLRANFERSMRRMLAILAGLLAYMVVVATDTVEPYRSAVGQVWLLIPIAIWASSLVWLRRLSRYERSGRFVTRSALQEAAR